MKFIPVLNKGITSSQSLDGHQVTFSDMIFTGLLALISTVIAYQFATGNQLEQLPIILRQIDPNFLSQDFFLSTTQDFGPRTYYSEFIGLVCQLLPLPWVYASLTFITDFALATITIWAARSVIGANRLGAFLAAIMTLGLASFHLGDATQIRYEIFQPASLAIPGALAAIVLGIKGRPITAAGIAALASLPHPLYGAEGGGIALGIAFFALLLPLDFNKLSFANLNWRAAIIKTSAGVLLLGVSLAFFWWLPNREVNIDTPLSTEDFYRILVHFRAPHHYLPSFFRPQDYVSTLFFLLATACAYERWIRSVNLHLAILVTLPIVTVLLACFCAYLFSEIIPSRLVLTLQLFRLLSIIKWLGFLLIAWVFSDYLLSPQHKSARPLALISLLSTGVTQPLLASVTLLSTRLQDLRWFNLNPFLYALPILLITPLLWFKFGSLAEAVYLVSAYILILSNSAKNNAIRILGTGVICIFLLVLINNRGSATLAAIAPKFDFHDQRHIAAETSRGVAAATPEDALLLAPPDFGLIRVIGQRALVVDFKNIPFQDQAMLAWFERMRTVYGKIEGAGFTAQQELVEAYKNINDRKLLNLSNQYKATHALLYTDTETSLPTLYKNANYRLVQLTAVP